MNPLLLVFGALMASDTTVVPTVATNEVYDGSAGQTSIVTPLVLEPDVRIDGVIDAKEWEQAVLLRGFTQYDPVEGRPATQRTEILLFVSDAAVYMAVRAFDTNPDQIRATLSDRDNVVRRDDYVRLSLDTFNDQRRASVFIVNPLGVQQDGVWLEGGGGGRRHFGPPIDWNPDFLWESSGQITDWGWSAEVRIPFKSLRFPERDVQSWGLQVVRRIERSGFEEAWHPISRDRVNQLEQSGSLTNLRGLDPGLFLELNPVMTSSVSGALDSDTDRFDRSGPNAEVGLNLTYGLTSNLTLDGTINPDFSQVESDAGQIAVNERFALFFEEQRPFFLEGTEVFGMPKQLIHTRSIVNPIAGAKITGKQGSFSVGYLGALDQVSTDSGKDTWVNLFRIRRDVGSNSNVGVVYTDRTETGSIYNRLAGMDGRFVIGNRYSLSMLGAFSRTGTVDSDPANGGMWTARLERSGREFSFNAEIEDWSESFRAASGFIRRVGITQVSSRASRNWLGAQNALVERWGPSLQAEVTWERDDFWSGRAWQEAELELGSSVSFRGNTTLFGNVFVNQFNFDREAYDGLFTRDGANGLVPFFPDQDVFSALWGARLSLFFSRWQRFRGRVNVGYRESPIFERSTGAPAEIGGVWTTDGNFTLYPLSALAVEVGVRHSVIERQSDGSTYSTATIPRIRAQYQLSRALFVRTIAEYGAQERVAVAAPDGSALESCSDGVCEVVSGSTVNDISVEALVGYEPSPGTVFFLGYSRRMEDFGAFRFDQVETQADGLFLKLSYRFRR